MSGGNVLKSLTPFYLLFHLSYVLQGTNEQVRTGYQQHSTIVQWNEVVQPTTTSSEVQPTYHYTPLFY